MKKIMTVTVALMFVSAMAFTSMAFADGPMGKGKPPMSDKSKEGKRISEDAKAKAKAEAEKHEAEMRLMDEMHKEQDKQKKEGETDKKHEGKMKGKRF